MPKQFSSASEGRACAARPSLRLLLAVTAACVPALAASTAQAAAPEQLTLTGTTPKSSSLVPANSTTPLVFGGEEGVINNVVRFGTREALPISAVGNPGNEIGIYTNPECNGAPLETGTLEQLEETGVQVEVEADEATPLYADQTDLISSETSECSSPALTYYESSTVVTPPEEEPSGGGGGGPSGGEQQGGAVSANAPVAPRLHTVPAGRANNNAPRITGSAAGAGRVKIFTNSSCSGAPIANVSAAEFAGGIAAQVPDNSVTDFAGLSVASGKQSYCSPPATYIEDSLAPHTRITMGPGSKTRRHKAVFRFADTSGEAIGTHFKCKVDRHKWKSCHSPFKLRHLGFHSHVLRVRGTDQIGNREHKPAKRRFKVIH